MPTAEYFYASGKGNGFPFCLEKVNVSGFDYWATLGGFNKDSGGSPSPAQISLSFQNAWRLYWMVYGLNYTQIVSSVDDSGSINVVDDNSNQLTPPPGVEPINRLCENAFTSQSSVNTDGYGVAFGYPSTDFYVGFRSTATTVPIVRMYNGVTMTESNFVGYGVRSNYTQFYSDGNFPEPPVAGIFAPFQTLNVNYIILQSYMDELSPSSTTSAYGYTNLPISGSVNTIPFVCGIEVDEVVTASAANRSVTLGATEETTIDSIEFYTPPT